MEQNEKALIRIEIVKKKKTSNIIIFIILGIVIVVGSVICSLTITNISARKKDIPVENETKG